VDVCLTNTFLHGRPYLTVIGVEVSLETITPVKKRLISLCAALLSSSTSKGVNINSGNPKIGQHWGSAPLGWEA